MNIQQYIESGVLEAYVFGELNEEQSAEVLKMAQQYTEIKNEITRIEIAMENLAFEEAELPPQHVREQVLGKVIKNPGSDYEISPLTIEHNSSTKRSFNYSIAASVALLIGSVAANIWLYSNLQKEKEKVAGLVAEKQVLAGNLKTQQAAYAEANLKYELSKQKQVAQLQLSGTENMPEALANIYWDEKTGATYLNIDKVKTSEPGTSYQLWAIADGKPVDAGVFSSADAGHLKSMKVIQAAKGKVQAFAVTIEKAGGSPAPTLEKMVLIGKFG